MSMHLISEEALHELAETVRMARQYVELATLEIRELKAHNLELETENALLRARIGAHYGKS